jgi:hypothetical protein
MRYNKRSMSVIGELSGNRKNHAREKDKGEKPGDKRGVLPDLYNPPDTVYKEVSWRGNLLASPTQTLAS